MFWTILLLFVFQNSVLVSCYEKLYPQNISSNITANIYLLYHKGPNVNNYTKISYEDSLSFSEYSEFDKNKETIFYFHGWTEEPSKNEESVDTISKAFLDKHFVNLVVFDYSSLVKGNDLFNYYSAFQNVSEIGKAVGYFLSRYIPNVQSGEKVHLIGHSLGSQIMSKTAIAYGKGQLYWLTALDPAGPLFNIPLIDHLSKDDAKFVDVIHTDGWFYGDGRSIGHVDFFPNLGIRNQPYCNQQNSYEFCSHHMSWRYYAESIMNSNSFAAKKCQLNLFCNRFTLSWCCDKNAPVNFMGYGVNKTLRGDFYLKTNTSYPYNMNKEGFYV